MFSNNGFNNLNPYTDLKLLNEAKKHSDKSRYWNKVTSRSSNSRITDESD